MINTEIRYVKESDQSFWFDYDKHLSLSEFHKKVRDRQGYVLLLDDMPVGILRYNLFWDNTPFCTLLYIDEKFRRNGFGKKLMNFWENEMRSFGYDWVLISTQANESAQYFYRSVGYTDCGSFTAPEQPEELFLYRRLSERR